MGVKRTMYQRKVDMGMLNAVKSVLPDVSSVSSSSEQRVNFSDEGLTIETFCFFPFRIYICIYIYIGLQFSVMTYSLHASIKMLYWYSMFVKPRRVTMTRFY